MNYIIVYAWLHTPLYVHYIHRAYNEYSKSVYRVVQQLCTGWFNNCVLGGLTIVYRVVQQLCTGWFKNCVQGGSTIVYRVVQNEQKLCTGWFNNCVQVVQQLCTGWFKNCLQGGSKWTKFVYRVVQNEQKFCTGWFKMNKTRNSRVPQSKYETNLYMRCMGCARVFKPTNMITTLYIWICGMDSKQEELS